MRMILITLMLAVANAAGGAGQEIRCNYESGRVCDSTGCAEMPSPPGFLILRHVDDMPQLEDFELRRCDEQGCTPVAVSRSDSGIFTNLRQRGGAYFVRILHGMPPGLLAELERRGLATPPAPEGGVFMEVAPSSMTVYVYYGRCPGLVDER